MLQLINHDSQESAYLIVQYPWQFGKFTKAKFWVDTKNKYGQKLCFQYMEPNTQQWSKPKADLFVDICIMYVNEDPNALDFGLVRSAVIDFNTASQSETEKFSEEWYLNDYQRDVMLDRLRQFKSAYRTKFKNAPVPQTLPSAGAFNTGQYSVSVPDAICDGPTIGVSNVQISAPVVMDYDVAPFDAARLVLESYVPMTYDEAVKDRVAWAAHHQIKVDAEELLKTEPGYVEPVFRELSISDLSHKK